jgi:HSP20 family protein
MDLERYGTSGDIQELLSIRDRIDDILGLGSADVVTPRADLVDAGDAYQLIVEVPGVQQEDLEIGLEGLELTVAGIREPISIEAEIVFSERPSGHFQRTVELPGEVDRDGATAHLSDGLLIVTLPKVD